MSTKPRPEVGQKIYANQSYGGRRSVMEELIVVRVGRKWFYAAVEGGRFERQFSLDDWRENVNIGAASVAMTADELAEHRAAHSAQERSKAAGYEVNRRIYAESVPPKLTSAKLEAIAEILERP